MNSVGFNEVQAGDIIKVYCRTRPVVYATVLDRTADDLILETKESSDRTIGRIEIVRIDRIHPHRRIHL